MNSEKYKCILISDKIINKYNLYNIRNLYISHSISNLEYGILLCLETEIINYLNNLDSISYKIEFINSLNFINKIKSKCLLICKNNICEIWELEFKTGSNFFINLMLKDITNHVNSKKITFWTCIPYKINMLNILKDSTILDNDFHNPYICTKSPLGYELKSTSICFYKDEFNVKKDITLKLIKYILQQYELRNNYCYMNAIFSSEVLDILKQLPHSHTNEISGVLTITNSFYNKSKSEMIWKVDLIEGTKSEGDNENIIIENDRYTFHTHPKDAYIRYNVEFGWPSGQDYVGFLNGVLSVKSLFHVVVTIEGVYIISLSKDYADKYLELTDKFEYILNKYSISKKAFKSPYDYINYVNKELKIFYVTFIEWNNLLRSKFIVYFPKTKNNCII